MQGDIGQGCIAAEIRITTLVDGERCQYIRAEILDKQMGPDIGPVEAGIDGLMFEKFEGFPGGGGTGGRGARDWGTGDRGAAGNR